MPLTRTVQVFAAGVLIEESQRDFDWNEVRAERERELNDTDWRAVKDRTMSQAWKDYRQALRDLPQDHASANDAADNWPSPPE
tara:strand:+ start:765 stop:1013 length:249 start_codon:yes stop_codon:yes gene_type:complete